MGWFPCKYKRMFEVIRLWNRLINMEDERITKTCFIKDMENRSNNWSSNVMQLFEKLEISSNFDQLLPVEIEAVRPKIVALIESEWKTQVDSKPKLRSYKLFKSNFGAEEYVCQYLSRYKRSLFAQLRSGILPLNIEIGRYRGVRVEDRICCFCTPDKVESEMHFMVECCKYDIQRAELYNKLSFDITFANSNNQEKYNKLMRCYYKEATEFVAKAWTIRQNNIFN